MATVLWQDVETGALDRCRLEAGPDGLELLAFGAPGVADVKQDMGWWSETD